MHARGMEREGEAKGRDKTNDSWKSAKKQIDTKHQQQQFFELFMQNNHYSDSNEWQCIIFRAKMKEDYNFFNSCSKNEYVFARTVIRHQMYVKYIGGCVTEPCQNETLYTNIEVCSPLT